MTNDFIEQSDEAFGEQLNTHGEGLDNHSSHVGVPANMPYLFSIGEDANTGWGTAKGIGRPKKKTE